MEAPSRKTLAPLSMSGSASRCLLDAVDRGDIEMLRTQLAAGAPRVQIQSKILLGKLKARTMATTDSADITDKCSPLATAAATALRRAAAQGRSQIVEELIKWGSELESRDASGQTPLISACTEKSNSNHIAIVRLLLEHGADANACTYGGRTALHKACYYGLEEIVKMLLDYVADLDVLNEIGSTPLISAMYSKHYGIARLLVDRGARVDVRNSVGKRAIDFVDPEIDRPLVDALHQSARRQERMRLLWLASARALPDVRASSGAAAITSASNTSGVKVSFRTGDCLVGAPTITIKSEPVDSWMSLHADLAGVKIREEEDRSSDSEDKATGRSSKSKQGNLVYRIPLDVVRDAMGYL